jgi:hypothetical protein
VSTARALALEPLEGLHALVGLRRPPGREGAAVAAVEDEHLAAGPARVHRLVELRRGDRREHQRLAAGVRHRQVQAPFVVLEPVPGEVEQGQVVSPAVPVEVGDGLADDVVRLIDERGDVEAGDLRVLEDRRERLGVVLGRGQPAQAPVGVLVGGDGRRYRSTPPARSASRC